jgi:hypothetical protein
VQVAYAQIGHVLTVAHLGPESFLLRRNSDVEDWSGAVVGHLGENQRAFRLAVLRFGDSSYQAGLLGHPVLFIASPDPNLVQEQAQSG